MENLFSQAKALRNLVVSFGPHCVFGMKLTLTGFVIIVDLPQAAASIEMVLIVMPDIPTISYLPYPVALSYNVRDPSYLLFFIVTTVV